MAVTTSHIVIIIIRPSLKLEICISQQIYAHVRENLFINYLNGSGGRVQNDVSPLATRFEMDEVLVSVSSQPTPTNERTGNIWKPFHRIKIFKVCSKCQEWARLHPNATTHIPWPSHWKAYMGLYIYFI